MRFDFTIHADNMAELRDALAQIGTALPVNVFANPRRGFRLVAEPEWDNATTVPDGSVVQDTESYSPATLAAVTVAPVPKVGPTKVRKPKLAPALAAASVQDEHSDRDGLGEDYDNETAEQEDGGAGDADEPETAGTTESEALSPADAKLRALNLLRECYALPGGPAAVKAVQTRFGVKKFVDVPDADGTALFGAARDAHSELSA